MKGSAHFLRKTWIFPFIVTMAGYVCYLLTNNDYTFVVLNIIALQSIAVIGLNLLIDATGQVSIGHAAFYGIGAYTSALLTVNLGLPLWAGFIASVITVAIISLVLAVPTMRLHGHYLVMATLGFNIIVSIVLNQWESLTGGPSGFAGIKPIATSDREFFVLCWMVFVLVLWFTLGFQKTVRGKTFKAIRQNEIAVESCGINVSAHKIFAFVLSALYAGISGFLYAHYTTFISPKTFNIFRSLQWVTMSVLGGMGNIVGGVIGTFLLTSLPELLHNLEEWHVFFYGLILITCLVFFPQGFMPFFENRFAANRKNRKKSTISQPCPITILKMVDEPAKRDSIVLKDVSVNFGGLQVLNRVNAVFEPGKVHGIIGPNGAGKTTLFNVICGFIKTDSGSVFLGKKDITNLSPHVIARFGIGRTFQNSQIFPELTVFDHLLVAHKKDDTNFLMNVLHFFGLADLAFVRAEELSLFEIKRLEMARLLATRPTYIFLDEPCAGLNKSEKEQIAEYIGRLRKHGMTIILIDHHMDFVMNVASSIVVLHQGSVIAYGSPREVRNHPKVIKAYLGSEIHKTVYHA